MSYRGMWHENAADKTKVAQRQLGTIGPPTKKKRFIKTYLWRIQWLNDGTKGYSKFFKCYS
jgi:hypothetical protein